jgi:hypothetical protein
MQRSYFQARWLDQVIWTEGKAQRAEKMYVRLRVATLVGGASATAFASLKLSGAAATWISALIFALTLTTTIAAGLEELMKFGQQRARYRDLSERLKTEGWLFLQLVGPYSGVNTQQRSRALRHGLKRFSALTKDDPGTRRTSLGWPPSRNLEPSEANPPALPWVAAYNRRRAVATTALR